MARLTYLNAYITNNGDSFIAEHTAKKDPRAAEFPTKIDENTGTVMHTKPREWFCSSTTSSKDAEQALAMLRPMAVSALMEPMQYGLSLIHI